MPRAAPPKRRQPVMPTTSPVVEDQSHQPPVTRDRGHRSLGLSHWNMYLSIQRYRSPLLLLAALLVVAAIFLPLWGMTLVSTQYPDGLRMIVFPGRIRGDIDEINALNHYIGMT